MSERLKHICPLCGGPNECALARKENRDTHCWCHDVTIDPESILRAQGTPNNDSCICKKCAAAASNTGMQQSKAKLYSTGFCHLCKEAEAILQKAGGMFIIVDISEDDCLLEKYGTRIPVLQRIDNDAELDWPFDAVTASKFLGASD